jgi:hypothetical protein
VYQGVNQLFDIDFVAGFTIDFFEYMDKIPDCRQVAKMWLESEG